MKSTVLKFGLLSGLLLTAFMWATIPFMDAETDLGNSELIGYAGMLVSFSAIFIGIVQYRNQEPDGLISFGKAFKVGFLIALLASTLYVLSWMIMSTFVLPNFMTDYAAQMSEQLANSGLSAEELEIQLASLESWMEYYKNPFFKFFFTYIEILPLGTLVSLIAALILKKK